MLKIGIQFFAHHKGGGSTKNGRDSVKFERMGKDRRKCSVYAEQ